MFFSLSVGRLRRSLENLASGTRHHLAAAVCEDSAVDIRRSGLAEGRAPTDGRLVGRLIHG